MTPILLIMADLGTPFGALNNSSVSYLHWLQPDILSNTTLLTPAYTTGHSRIVPYLASALPPGSTEHRFVLLAFSQSGDAKFTMPADFEVVVAQGRTRFDVGRFAGEAGLGSVVAANWFTVVPNGENNTTYSTGNPIIPFEGGATVTLFPGWFVEVVVIVLTLAAIL
jgi:hypothetical protein